VHESYHGKVTTANILRRQLRKSPQQDSACQPPSGAPGRASIFAALRYRNYRLWFFGQMTSQMGSWVQSVAQGWMVYQLTGSELALGTIPFIGSLPTLFLMLPAGVIADRVPRKKVLLATQTVFMLLAFALALLAATGVMRVWHIYALAVCTGIANSFDAPARQSLAVEMVDDRRDLMNAIAMNSMMFNIARIVGPALAGVILAAFGVAWCFAINGVSFLAVLLALLAMRLPPMPRASRSQPVVTQMLEGLRYVWRNIEVRTIIAVVGVASLTMGSYSVLFPAFAADVFRTGATGLGWLNACMGVGALGGALTVATLGGYRRKGRILTIGNLAFPASVLLFALSASLAPALLGHGLLPSSLVTLWGMPLAPFFMLSLLALVGAGWGMMVQNATANTLVQTIVPDELRGRVMSAYMLVFFGTSPFGSLLMGSLAQGLGSAAGVAIAASAALAFSLLIVFTVSRLRRLEI
jgi:MFS family permease